MLKLPELAIKSERVVLTDSYRPGVILIGEGRIISILSPNNFNATCPVIDVGDSVVMPGLVDMHVHIHGQGPVRGEGFSKASEVSAAGGFTTIIDMPSSEPATTTADALKRKMDVASDRLHVDCGFWGAATSSNTNEIEGLLNAGAYGLTANLDKDSGPLSITDVELKKIMPLLAERRVPLIAHTQEEGIKVLINLSRRTGCRVHIACLPTAELLPEIAQARQMGAAITIEASPLQLFFCKEDFSGITGKSNHTNLVFQQEGRDLLWKGLRDHLIDLIASGRQPDQSGLSAMDLNLAMTWTMACRHVSLLEDVALWMSTNPARFMGLEPRKGHIAAGFDADLVIWDPEEDFTAGSLLKRHVLYDGLPLHGTIKKTFLRGVEVFGDGRLKDKNGGSVLRRGY